jgi:hypothetical protein
MSGRLVFNNNKILSAGTHIIAVPSQVDGMRLYRVTIRRNNNTGFSALGSGYRNGGGLFEFQDYMEDRWIYAEWFVRLFPWPTLLPQPDFNRGCIYLYKVGGLSVRLVKD